MSRRKFDSDTGEYVDMYYPLGYKGIKPKYVPSHLDDVMHYNNPYLWGKEQKMRNKISMIDPSIPKIDIFMLQPGQMFQYFDKRNPDAVYMKLDGVGDGATAVLLSSGMLYKISPNASLITVTAVQISSPI